MSGVVLNLSCRIRSVAGCTGARGRSRSRGGSPIINSAAVQRKWAAVAPLITSTHSCHCLPDCRYGSPDDQTSSSDRRRTRHDGGVSLRWGLPRCIIYALRRRDCRRGLPPDPRSSVRRLRRGVARRPVSRTRGVIGLRNAISPDAPHGRIHCRVCSGTPPATVPSSGMGSPRRRPGAAATTAGARPS